jgi:hypothetical protein
MQHVLSRPTGRLTAHRRPFERAFPLVTIVILSAAFASAALDGGQGALFLAMLGAMSALLIGIVWFVAFGRGAPTRQADLEEFGVARKSDVVGEPDTLFATWRSFTGSGLMLAPQSKGGPSEGVVRAFVDKLVPAPPLPLDPENVDSGESSLDALRAEAVGLISLAKVTGVNMEPYRRFLVDARKVAQTGHRDEIVRSLGFANDLLRSSVAKSFAKQAQAEWEIRDGVSRF